MRGFIYVYPRQIPRGIKLVVFFFGGMSAAVARMVAATVALSVALTVLCCPLVLFRRLVVW